MVTMLRELYDDFKRFLRDREVNGQRYYKLTPRGWFLVHVGQNPKFTEVVNY